MRNFWLSVLVFFTALASSGAQSSGRYYWDDPEFLIRQGGRFPTAVDNGTLAAGFWQERRQGTEGWPQSSLSVSVRRIDGDGWVTRHNVLGPFTIVGAESQFYSVVLTKSGTFWVAVLLSGGQVVVYQSDDEAQTFREDRRFGGNGTLVVPKLFLNAQDQPVLFVDRADAVSFRLASSVRSSTGWTDLKTVTTGDDERQSFQPTVVSTDSNLVLIYQSQFTSAATETEGRRITYQLYQRTSEDHGLTWGPPTRLTAFADDLSDNPDRIDNQRPSALWYDGKLFLTWERRTAQSQSVISVATWNREGKLVDNRLLTPPNFSARNPLFYVFQNQLHLAWFDNRNETYDVFLSSWNPDADIPWSDGQALSKDTANSVFGQPVPLGNDLYFFWQNTFGETPGIVFLQPDKRVDPPTLRPVNFKTDTKTKNANFTVNIVYPHDNSGIQAFNAILTQDPSEEPSHDRRIIARDNLWSSSAPAEGDWYIAVAVLDNAGNWSSAARIPFHLKTTPPGPVSIPAPPTDSWGFLVSNTFQLTWTPTTPDAVAYSWRLSRVGDRLDDRVLASISAPLPVGSPLTTATSAEGTNYEDGLWVLSVAAFDEAGNRGPVSSRFFRLNKFQPYTRIDSVDTQQDAFGRVQLALHGRGFLGGGAIRRVYLDRDGKAPWDYELGPDQFRIVGDRLIDQIRMEGLNEGTYRIGVDHPVRGTLFTGPILKVEPTGTVKIGDYRDLQDLTWQFFQGVTVFFSIHAVYFWLVMLLLATIVVTSGRLLAKVLVEHLEVVQQTRRWFADNPDKWKVLARRKDLASKRASLTVKFAVSILGLTGAVILMLALTLGFFITENSQRTLGTALQQRTQVLLDSLATGARTYLPTANYTELGNLPQQISAMEGEALYATITGPSSDGKVGLSYVYASNDPDIKTKTDTATLIPGVTLLNDSVEAGWSELQKQLNADAEAAVGDLVRQIDELTKQSRPLAEKTDATSRAQLRQFEDRNSALKRQVITKLAEVGGKARSMPDFNTRTLLASANRTYLFYQPFLYYTAGDPTYVRGLIRIEVSAATIEQQIVASRNQLVQVTIVVALIALGLGLVGAFLLSALTVNPIRKLVQGVAVIRDTSDKTRLEGHVIQVGTNDELAELASTVNQMTRGLVEGATRTQDLTKGKVEQKTLFIPLDKDSENQKLSTYHHDYPDIEVFAYYEGAKLVSGDLYEIRQLETQEGRNPESPWFGIMKGDVSGKGVEAGMVMAIAAMFVTTFFRHWREAKDAKNTKIDTLLYQINDTLEPILAEAGRGLFVALNVGVLNSKTGALRFAQAGDNLLHIWRGQAGHFESVDLKKTVSVGAMPSELHGIRYANQDLVLSRGDTLLYFTDGVEESQAAFRDTNWNPTAYFDPDDPSTVAEPNAVRRVPVFEGGPLRDVKAQNTEDFSADRIEGVISAYFRREVYELKKKNWLHPDHVFHFDFRTCDGSAQTLIKALISIDRIFRLVPDPKATADDWIDLDLVQDDFLSKHFVEYPRYFKDGYHPYEQGDPSKGDIVNKEGFRLVGTKRIPLWKKGNPASGQTCDASGYLIIDGDRVQDHEKARPRTEDERDAEGYRLVNGQRVLAFVRGNRKRGDLVDADGYLVEGGRPVDENPGYIRYPYLKEDHQFDDLTLLAIRRK